MIISTKKGTPKEELEKIVDKFEHQGLDVTLITGKDYNVFGLVGDTTKIDERDVLANPWIDNVTRVSAPYKRANRLFHPADSVIDCGGGGYACATTNYTLSQLKKGERARLYTYLHVREDIFELYGFASQQELNSFKMLIGVSGVGPKAALAILSATTPQNLALSIVTEDEKALTAAQGIGKKIAQRIILELKDKLAKEQSNFTVPSGGGSAPMPLGGSKSGEAAAALANGMMLIFADFGKCKFADPASPEAQALVKRLQAYISENYYHCTPEMLNALGAMYRAGGSFTKNIDNAGGEGTAEFAARAIDAYCR